MGIPEDLKFNPWTKQTPTNMTNAHDTFIFTEMASILKAIHPSFKNHPLGFTVLKNQEDPGFDLQVK